MMRCHVTCCLAFGLAAFLCMTGATKLRAADNPFAGNWKITVLLPGQDITVFLVEIKSADGKKATVDDFRIILKSDLIINSPTAYLDSLPADLKAAITKAYLDAATKDKAAFDRLSDGKNRPWETVDNAAYGDTIKLIQFVDRLRKANG